jgi:hypothetical protein
MAESIDIKRAAASIAKMVDEFTERGWNNEGLANFAEIVSAACVGFCVAPTPPLTAEEKK